jgi:hypothetical protein
MDSAADNAPTLKRSSSRRSVTASSEADTLRSQRSSNSTAYYRYKHLAAAQVYIHTDPPAKILDAINAVVKAEVSKERRAEVTGSARTMRSITASVKKRVKRASGLLESIVLGIWPELVVWFRSIASNLMINLSGEKPGGCFFARLGLYWVGGTKSWSFDRPLFIGREGMVDACGDVNKQCAESGECCRDSCSPLNLGHHASGW